MEHTDMPPEDLDVLQLHLTWHRAQIRDTHARLLGILSVLDHDFSTFVRIISRRSEAELSHPFWDGVISHMAALGVACASLRDATDALARCSDDNL